MFFHISEAAVTGKAVLNMEEGFGLALTGSISAFSGVVIKSINRISLIKLINIQRNI